MMLRLFLAFALLIVSCQAFAGRVSPIGHAPSQFQEVDHLPSSKRKAKKNKKQFLRKRDDKEPFKIMGFEPFTMIGLGLTVGGIFFPVLLPLGILSLVFGFVRYKSRPKTYKGEKNHLKIFLLGLIVPITAFLGLLIFRGKVREP